VKELSLHLLDLVENSVDAGARRVEISIVEDPVADRLALTVRDDGRGMAAEMAAAAADPFVTSRTTRSVGLGLALLSAAAEQAGGGMTIESAPGQGTEVRVEFQLSHVDRAPLGRIEDTLASVAALHPDLEVHYAHRGAKGEYAVDLAKGGLLPHPAQSTPGQMRQEIARLVREGRARIGSVA
jgi:anti-sigma regulatory factor (Ser/Thr protein kinase)